MCIMVYSSTDHIHNNLLGMILKCRFSHSQPGDKNHYSPTQFSVAFGDGASG